MIGHSNSVLEPASILRFGLEDVSASNKYVPGLDGLRAISISVVVLGHFFLPTRGGIAALGVYLFFVISGFLITRLLYAELKRYGFVDTLAFYARRILRLYPVLLVFLVAVSVIVAGSGEKVAPIEILSVVLYFNNYLISFYTLHGVELSMPVGALWSLAVEEHFYLIAPLFFISVRGNVKAMLWFSVVAFFFPLAIRVYYVSAWPEVVGNLITYRNSETRFDSIAVGVFLAVMCETSAGSKLIKWLGTPVVFFGSFVIVLIAAGWPGNWYRETLRFSLLSLACLPIICGAVWGKMDLAQRALNLQVVVWVGRLSYSLYVWHLAVAYATSHFLPPLSLVVEGTLNTLISIVVAHLSYRYIELPALSLKKYIRSRRSVVAPM